MNGSWIADDEWARIQGILPIVCVDVLSVRFAPGTQRIAEVGLILRETPHQGTRWCLVGGRVNYGESLAEAITRHMYDTLGTDIRFQIPDNQQPLYVAQYIPTAHDGFPIDPRKHAVSLTYWLEIDGNPISQNEAIDFAWFSLDKLPPPHEFGFGQNLVVTECLNRLQPLS